MRKIATTLCAMLGIAAWAGEINIIPGGAEVATDRGGNTVIEFYTPRSLRVLKGPGNKVQKLPHSMSVIAKPAKVKVKAQRTDSTLVLSSEAVRATVNLSSGRVSFADASGKMLTAESSDVVFTPMNDAGTPSFTASQTFALAPGEAIYGLGNLENGRLNQRGENRTLQPGNVEDGIPVFLSVKGYGIYWDNYSPTLFSETETEGVKFQSEVADAVDYYFMYGADLDGVIGEIRTLTGDVPMLPLWTYGFWQSRERYKSQEELLEVVNRYRADGVPFDGIIQDWQYWGNNYLWNAMEFMNPAFNNAQAMIDKVHAANAHMIISIWSSFGPQTRPYRELNAKGMLFNFSTWPQSGIGEVWPPNMDYPSGVRVYDAYNPEARDIYWKHLTRLHNMKIDGWWMDSTEPDHLDWKPEDMDTKTYLGSFRRVRSAYPLLTVGSVYDHQRDVDSTKRVFILTRSGFMGQQRYGANVWTGDVVSTWELLRNQLCAMLNFSLTGNPMTNSDIGGFFAGAYNKTWCDGTAAANPAYRELYTRWMQMGAFTPMMRSHGTEVPRELYYYGKAGEPVYDAMLGAIKLRYSLLPYIYSTGWEVTGRRGTFMRALPMDFAADEKTHNLGSQFMFGKALMVAPIVKAQYTPEVQKTASSDEEGWNQNTGNASVTEIGEVDFTRPMTTEVYLPAGTSWWNYFTGEKYDGGRAVTLTTTLGSIPLFARAGAIIPIGPDVTYATEKPWDNLTVKVFPGADGSFTLYEDEGDNYNYEHGAYSEIPMRWNDKARTFTIGGRNGQYPGMITSRQFTITMPDGTSKTVDYTGKKLSVKL